jgi:hypothetical protein
MQHSFLLAPYAFYGVVDIPPQYLFFPSWVKSQCWQSYHTACLGRSIDQTRAMQCYFFAVAVLVSWQHEEIQVIASAIPGGKQFSSLSSVKQKK